MSMQSHPLPPSPEVAEEARRRAARLAEGLYPHQVDGVAFLLGRRRSILADDMGLGKTRQSVVAMHEAAPQGPWLVICPAAVKLNWAREIGMARPDAEVRVVGPGPVPAPDYRGWSVVNYDLLRKHESALKALPWAGFIFDEAHFLKNHQTQRSRHGRALVKAAPENPAVMCLTGTPITNRPRDLFPLLQLLEHPMARSFLTFAKRYCAAYKNDYGWVTDGASNLAELKTQLDGVLLRRTKEEVLDLPPKVRTYVPLEIPEGVGRQEMRQALRLLMGGGATNVGARSRDRMRLLGALTTARHKVAMAKTPLTEEFVENVLDQGDKALVFSCFDDPLQKLAQHFGEKAVLVTGATPVKKRQQLVDRFQQDENTRVFLANIIAGGVGLNLTAARQVVFNDLDWVPANHFQAEDRAYRIGQNGSVNVAYMYAKDTIEDFVQLLLERKTLLMAALGSGSVSGEDEGNVLDLIERLFQQMSPGVADTPVNLEGPDAVHQLVEQLRAHYVDDQPPQAVQAGAAPKLLVTGEAIERLARALVSDTKPPVYRVRSNSDPRKSYVIEPNGPDLLCSCPGFEYRGTCSHVTKLRQALVGGGPLPAGYERE